MFAMILMRTQVYLGLRESGCCNLRLTHRYTVKININVIKAVIKHQTKGVYGLWTVATLHLDFISYIVSSNNLLFNE